MFAALLRALSREREGCRHRGVSPAARCHLPCPRGVPTAALTRGTLCRCCWRRLKPRRSRSARPDPAAAAPTPRPEARSPSATCREPQLETAGNSWARPKHSPGTTGSRLEPGKRGWSSIGRVLGWRGKNHSYSL